MPTSRLTDCSCGTFDMFRCCLTAKNAIRFSASPTHSLLFSASLCFSPTQPTRLPHSLAFARPALPFQPTFSSLFSAAITRLASTCDRTSRRAPPCLSLFGRVHTGGWWGFTRARFSSSFHEEPSELKLAASGDVAPSKAVTATLPGLSGKKLFCRGQTSKSKLFSLW